MCSEVFNEWTTKEKFILACCVSRSGDQNWVSVSRTIKLINEACGDSDNRPPEWFSQKNCAMKYNELLGTASSSKRKSRGGPAESVNIETPAEQVLRKLTFARIDELNRTIELEREKFKKLKSDLQKIQSGKIDDQLPAIWEAIQSSKPQSLEKLIKDDPIGGSSSKAQQGTSQASASSSGLSRPQRASKETEKFKSYIEQRQKHLAKYQQSQVSTVGVTTLSPVISTGSAQTVTTVTPSAVVTPAAVSSIASPSLKGTVTGHVPTQVSNLTSQSESAISVTKDANKPKQQPINTVSPKKLDVKDSFLSNLLSAPTKEIKEQVNQITEILKEPIKNPHHISDESYQAYLKAQPATTPSIAPVLSKLLEVPSGEISTAATTDTVLEKTQNSTTKAPIERQASCENTDSQTINKTKSVDDSVNTKETRTTQVELSDKSKIQVSESGSNVEKKPTNSEKLLKSRKEDIISKLSETLKKSPLKKELLKLSDKIPKKSETEAEKTDVTNQAENLTVKTMDVEENKVEIKDSSQEKTDEPPAKKRHSNTTVADNTLVSQESVPVEPSPPKTKKKGKGRSRTSTKKKVQPSQSNSFNVEMIADEDFSQSSFNDSSNNSKNESDFVDDIINKKVSTPLTPSVSSPASPALSIGSNCDPEVAQQQRAWRKNIMMVWKAAASHKYANVFLHPVTDEEAPGYSSIIYKPMDLSLIKKNIETGVTTTTAEFQRDIMLMFQNALMYNRKEHDVYRMATEMRDDVMEQIQSFISTQLMVQSTSEQRDAKILRLKPEGQGQTRQSIKSNSSL